MATLSFGVNGPNMQFTVDMQIQDSDAPRILAYLASTNYGKVVVSDTETRAATTEECAQAFAAGILRGLLDQTVSYERQQAALTAANAIAAINPV